MPFRKYCIIYSYIKAYGLGYIMCELRKWLNYRLDILKIPMSTVIYVTAGKYSKRSEGEVRIICQMPYGHRWTLSVSSVVIVDTGRALSPLWGVWRVNPDVRRPTGRGWQPSLPWWVTARPWGGWSLCALRMHACSFACLGTSIRKTIAAPYNIIQSVTAAGDALLSPDGNRCVYI